MFIINHANDDKYIQMPTHSYVFVHSHKYIDINMEQRESSGSELMCFKHILIQFFYKLKYENAMKLYLKQMNGALNLSKFFDRVFSVVYFRGCIFCVKSILHIFYGKLQSPETNSTIYNNNNRLGMWPNNAHRGVNTQHIRTTNCVRV